MVMPLGEPNGIGPGARVTHHARPLCVTTGDADRVRDFAAVSQAELAQGRLPAAELLDGALVLVGGVLLLTPGFFTDLLGLFLLIPASRALIKQFVGLWLQRRLDRGTITIGRI